MSENERFLRWYFNRYGHWPESERVADIGKQLWQWAEQQPPLGCYRNGVANMRRRNERREENEL